MSDGAALTMTDGAALSMTDVGYVILFVTDMDRSVAFYRDVLGVPVRQPSPEWTELGTDGTTLALHRSDVPPPEATAATPTVVFNVADVRATREELARRHDATSELKEVWRGGGVVGLSANFQDPEGNRLSIHGTVPEADWP